MCTDIWKPSLIASAFFIGWSSTLLWVPRLADIYGRRRIFAYGQVISAVLYTIIMLSDSLNVIIAVSFLSGMLNSVRVNIGYVFMIELMPKSSQAKITTTWNIFEGSIYVLATFYFWQVSKNWLYFVAIGYGLSIYSAITVWSLPESPRYLVETQRLDEARESLLLIARINRRELTWDLSLFKKSDKP